MNIFNDWLSWSNLFYLIGLILAGALTLVSTKYRKIMTEVGEVAKTLEDAYEDNVLTTDEKQKIMKEMLDVLKAVINLKWQIWK